MVLIAEKRGSESPGRQSQNMIAPENIPLKGISLGIGIDLIKGSASPRGKMRNINS